MTVKEKIRFWFDDLKTPMGRATDLVIMGLIVLACVLAVALTYDADWPTPTYTFLIAVDEVITLLFLVEYLLRLWVAEHRLKYVFSLYAIIDLIAILPAVATAHHVFHAIRVFRLLRIFRLIRFLETQQFFFGKLKQVHLYVLRVAFTLFTIPFVSAGLILHAERGHNPELQTFFEAFYYSVVTLTTVGFGDIVPVTPAGRLMSILMILSGVIFIPWQVKNLIAYFLTARQKVFCLCSNCGLEYHEREAKFCRRCGKPVDPQKTEEV